MHSQMYCKRVNQSNTLKTGINDGCASKVRVQFGLTKKCTMFYDSSRVRPRISTLQWRKGVESPEREKNGGEC